MDRHLRELVWQRARNRCENCQFPADVSLLPFQIDHVISEKHGGATVAENLALSCERCNSHKGASIAGYLAGRHVRLFNPRKDRWSEHFEWKGPFLVGKTEIGIVTINVLAINLAYRVALRAALLEEGLIFTDDQPDI
jgi:hypothetical protein